MRKIFVVAALVIGSQLCAQQDSSKTLDEVVITANKFPQKQSTTGKHLTVITREQILRSAGKDLAQVLNETAGLVVNGATSNPGKDKSVFLQGASSAHSLILLDGIPLNDPTGVGGTFDIRLLPLENVEKIEILKGSQSTLYGSNAVAGVINIISKKITDAKPQINGLLTYGSYNSFKGNANLAQKIKWFEYNVNYVYNRTDGISEAKDTAGNRNFDNDGFTQNALQAILGFNLSDKLKISPHYRFTKFKGGYDADAFRDAPNRYTGSLENTGLNGHYNYKNGSVQFNYGYDNTKRDYVSQYGEYVTEGKFNNAEAYTDPSLSKNIRLVAGLSFQSYRINKPDTTNSIISPYASLFFKTDQGLNIEVGGRFNHHNKYGNNFSYSFNPSYLVDDHVKLFVNLTTGFRAPSISELFGPFGGNPELKPEKSSAQEAGIQSSMLNHKLDLTLSVFNRTINDVIIYKISGYENRDKQKDYGAEIELHYAISAQFDLKLSYDYVNGNITQKLSNKDTTYYNLIRRPKNNFHGFLQYHLNHFTASTSIQLTGKRSDTYYDPTTYSPLQVNLKSYSLVNLYAAYGLYKNKLNVFVDAKNLTNSTDYYEVYGFGVTGFNVTGGIRFQF